KSLLARAFVALLPPPDPEERLAITRILSATGRWPGGLVATRPFRAPHHTTSYAGLVGGGNPPQPGEITLAHAGVLFLDELAEFRREALEALRQPLEEGRITIARAGRRLDLPARFALVCAMNPCPCGYRGHHRVRCRCSPAEVWRYRRRISGPLLDRIDLRLELPAPGLDELAAAPRGGDGGGEGEAVRRSILDAHERTRERRDAPPNARLEADALDRLVPLGPRERRLLEEAVDQRGLSARAVQSLRRIARSIADLDGVERVDASHLAQALALRAPLL
ncbi:MAG: ATP-binding protein, partial [Planctomycetota bacterium]|nr:ATP-binding protein [Planctomycetota bacterium]